MSRELCVCHFPIYPITIFRCFVTSTPQESVKITINLQLCKMENNFFSHAQGMSCVKVT